MTTLPTPPRARRLGVLGVAVYTLLSPSGKIISAAAAAILLAGGLMTQLRPPSPPAAQAPVQASAPTPVAPTRLAHSGSSAPVFTYIEVDGQTLPVVLTENPTSNSSVGRRPVSASPSIYPSGGGGRGPVSASPSIYPSGGGGLGPASASPSIYPSSGGGRGPGAGSPHSGPRLGSPSPGLGGLPPEASQPDGTPAPPPTTGHIPPTHLASSGDPADDESNDAGSPPPQGEPGNESRESPDNVAGSPSEAPGSQFPPENEAGAPRNEPLEPPFFASAPSPVEAPESLLPTGMDDPLNPLNPLIPLSEQPEPLLTPPYNGQSPPQTAVAVPEPSVVGLILLGLAALGWTGRRRLTPTRRA